MKNLSIFEPQIEKPYAGGFLYGRTRALAYFLNGIRKNCIYFGGFRKTGKLSDTKISYCEGRNMAKFQSYGH